MGAPAPGGASTRERQHQGAPPGAQKETCPSDCSLSSEQSARDKKDTLWRGANAQTARFQWQTACCLKRSVHQRSIWGMMLRYDPCPSPRSEVKLKI